MDEIRTTELRGREPWRSVDTGHNRRRRRRYVQRGLLSLIVLSLALWLSFALFFPLLHPNTHLLIVTPEQGPGLGIPALPFLDSTVSELEQLRPGLYQDSDHPEPTVLDRLGSAGELGRLRDQLSRLPAQRSDILMMFVTAHGISYGGAPHLVPPGFMTMQARGGLVSVERLLDEFAASPAGVKLLLLDSGSIQYDPRLGILQNEFPQQLKRAVARFDVEPAIWVLHSHSTGERSHVSRTWGNTVFAHFVTEGLQGAADLDSDRKVDLKELHHYVATHVSAWVDQYSGGAESQTPQLFASKGQTVAGAAAPVLMSVIPFRRRAGAPTAAPVEEREPTPAEPAAAEAAAAVTHPTRWEPRPRLGPSKPPLLAAGSLAHRWLFGPHTALVWQSATAAANLPATTPAESAAAGPIGADATPAKTSAIPAAGQPAGGGGPAAQVAADQADANQSDAVAAEQVVPGGAKTVQPALPPATTSAELWQLRDRLEKNHLGRPRPIDAAPHWWRIIVSRMEEIEQLNWGGREDEAAQRARKLGRVLQPLVAGSDALLLSSDQLGREIARRIEDYPVVIERPSSLGLAVSAAGTMPADLDPRHRQAIDVLDRLIEDGKPEGLPALLTLLSEEDLRFVELRLADRLAREPEIAWPSKQLALRASRLAEQVAALPPEQVVWIQDEIERADRARLSGQRILLDRIGAAADERAVEQLESSLVLYQAAAEHAALAQRASLVSHELMYRLPGYLRLHDAAQRSRFLSLPQTAVLQRLINTLGELVDILDQQDRRRAWKLESLLTLAERDREQLETPLRLANVLPLDESPGEKRAAWKVARLLQVTNPPWETRQVLLAAATTAEALFVKAFQPPDVQSLATPIGSARAEDRERLVPHAELEVAVARLAAQGFKAAEASLDEVERAWAEVVNGSSRELATTLAQLGQALEAYYRELPAHVDAAVRGNADLSDRSSRPGRLVELRAAERALGVIDVRDARPVEANPREVLRAAIAYDYLAWQSRRYDLQSAFAARSELDYLRAVALDYRQQARRIERQPRLSLPNQPRLRLDTSDRLSLAAATARPLNFEVHNDGVVPARMWLILDFDPQLLSVTARPDRRVYRELDSSAADQFSWSADEALPTFIVPAGSSRNLQLRVERLTRAVRPAKLVARVVSTPVDTPPPAMFSIDTVSGQFLADTTRGDLRLEDTYLRSTVAVDLPVPETIQLQIQGISGSWSQSRTGLVLHPFPNRATQFRVSLANTTSEPQQVDVQLIMPDRVDLIELPNGTLTPDEFRQFLSAAEPATVLAAASAVELPPDSLPVPIPFIAAGGPGQEPAGEPDPAAEEGSGDPAADPLEPLGEIVKQLLVAITPQGGGRTTIHRVEVAPQRPRRYIRARAQYNLIEERIEIQASALHPSLMPPTGSTVEMVFDEPPAPGTQAKLAGELKPPAYATRLYCDVPVQSDPVKVSLAVDGFPRAFVFRVRCDADARNITAETALHAIRIVQPPPSWAVKAPAGQIPVVVQIDSPVGTFENGGDAAEVGIDEDLDREFREERTLTLSSDRQSQVDLIQLAPLGVLRLQTRVSDYQLALPSNSTQNRTVNVLGRLQAGGRLSWSDPVKVLLDGAAPEIVDVDLGTSPYFIVGTELAVSVGAADPRGSGVSQVRAALDVEGRGEFVAEPPPAELERVAPGRWTAALDTSSVEPGSYTLLIQATDVAGNASEYTEIKGVLVVTPEMAGKLFLKRTNQVSGVVRFGTEPVPNMQLMLEPLAEDQLAAGPVVSDKQGKFLFPEVPPGSYRLTAEGKYKNAGRLVKFPRDQPFFRVTVKPPPAKKIRLDVPVR